MRSYRLSTTTCSPRDPSRLHAVSHQYSMIERSPREPSQLHNKTLRRRRSPWYNTYSYERRHHFGHSPSSHFTMQTSRSHRIIYVLRYELQVSISILISFALRTIDRIPTLEILRTPTNMDPVLEDKTWMQFVPSLLTNLHMRKRQIHYKRETPIFPESFTLFIKSVTKHLQLHRSVINYRRLYIRSVFHNV